MEYFFWVMVATLIYIYFGYPMLLVGLAAVFKRKPCSDDNYLPMVSMVIPAYNEALVIRPKIENCLKLDYPRDKLEILVVSDGSDDGTDDIVGEYTDRGIRLHRMDPRGGKIRALNAALEKVYGEIILFSDANPMYEPDAVSKLVRHFADEQVGVVTGDVRLFSPDISLEQSSSLYYRYERFIQQKESDLGSVIGADGAMYAIRKKLYVPLPPDRITDDLSISMRIAQQGYRVIYEPQAIGFEDAPKSHKEEFRAKSRYVAQGLQSVKRRIVMPHWWQIGLIFKFWSHKMLRWLSPFFMLGSFVSNLFLLHERWYMILFILQIVWYCMAVVGCFARPRQRYLFLVPFYFCLVNLAALEGVIKALFNLQPIKWRQSTRSPMSRLPRSTTPPTYRGTEED